MVGATIGFVGIGTVTVLLAVSAFFSSSETAIFSVPAAWFDRQAETGDSRALALKELRDDPHRLLVTLLVASYLPSVPQSR